MNGLLSRILNAWRTARGAGVPASQQDARSAVEGGASAPRIRAADLGSDNPRRSRWSAVAWRGPRSEARRAVVMQNRAEVLATLRGRA